MNTDEKKIYIKRGGLSFGLLECGPLELIVVLLFVYMAMVAGFFGTIYLPFYLASYLRHGKLAKKRGPEAPGPSLKAPISLAVSLVISYVIAAAFAWMYTHRTMKMNYEVPLNLSSIYELQNIYRSVSGEFAGGGRAFDILGWTVIGSGYTYYLDSARISHDEYEEIHPPLGKDWPLIIAPATSSSAFTAFAVGNIDDDECLDVFMINDTGVPVHIIDDSDNKAMRGICRDCPWADQRSVIGQWLSTGYMRYEPTLAFFLSVVALAGFLIFIALEEKDIINMRKLFAAQRKRED